jgi:erythromycin esterase
VWTCLPSSDFAVQPLTDTSKLNVAIGPGDERPFQNRYINSNGGISVKNATQFGLIGILVFTAFAADAGVDPYLNLDFEEGQPGASPRNWYAGGEGYSGVISTGNPHSGAQCLRLSKIDPQSEGFGVGTSTFPVAAAAGRTLSYSGWIRTEGVADGFAGLWWRVDGPDGMLAFDNMATRGITGDTEWTRYVIELDVDSTATNINFGCLLPGSGTAWFDDLRVELDGALFVQEKPVPFEANTDQVEWLMTQAHPFGSDDPTLDHSDLIFMDELVGDARIVALGEATHGTAEFFRMKHRLLRYLAEEKGFTLFAIEASMPEAERLNDYVLGGDGDPAELIAGMYFWTWKTEEVLAMVEWMRQYNEQGGHLEFHGNDMQFPGLAMRTALDFMQAHAPDLAADAAVPYAEMRGTIRAARNSGGKRAKVSDKVAAAVESVYLQLGERRDELVHEASPREVDWGIQNARLVAQNVGLSNGSGGERDRFMADNTDWLLQQAGPEAKIVIWAHNAHVSRDGFPGAASMGKHLAERHGSDMFVMGFCFTEGSYTAVEKGRGVGRSGTSAARPGSAEWAFLQTGQPRLIVDLRTAQPGSAESGWVSKPLDLRSIGAMAMDEAFSQKVLTDEFDALIYFETSTPSVQLANSPPSSWAMWD